MICTPSAHSLGQVGSEGGGIVFVEGLNAALLSVLQRPDLRILAEGVRVSFALDLGQPFEVSPDGAIVLGPSSIGNGRHCAFHLRHALEIATTNAIPGVAPCLAGLAAARVAALFWRLDGPADQEPVDWIGPLSATPMPDDGVLASIWSTLACLQGRPCAIAGDTASRLRNVWHDLGPVETLLAAGGDARLRVGETSRLNHYGCSHRPRPWALTFASSTASSLSERGFEGAEKARRRLVGALLRGEGEAAGLGAARRVREAIASHYDLPSGAGVVLTASGTDCELLALALTAAPGAPVTNLVTAPEETGSGVPLASIGRHFADDTSRGATVGKAELLAGMREDTVRVDLAVRRPDGTLIAPAEVDAACERLVEAAVAAGRRVLLHYLDMSKTGLVAPSFDCVARIGRRHRGRVDVVVDACQARLTAARVRSFVEIGWTVLITGSKFFTGPPFCGALLIPAPVMERLGEGSLPAGLADYTGRADWPDDVRATSDLSASVNAGMLLRWEAALAEMRAFARVPVQRTREILEQFTQSVREAIDASPDLVRVAAPKLCRPGLGDEAAGWDEIATIMPFLVLGPDRRPLGIEAARKLYGWLNADVAAALPAFLPAAERFLAGLRCHVGQPAPVADGHGGIAGALRISAGARLVSGEPSHAGIDDASRLAREIADARACLDKLSLLLRHRALLERHDPQPSFGAPPEPLA